jgi:hypothetical protein
MSRLAVTLDGGGTGSQTAFADGVVAGVRHELAAMSTARAVAASVSPLATTKVAPGSSTGAFAAAAAVNNNNNNDNSPDIGNGSRDPATMGPDELALFCSERVTSACPNAERDSSSTGAAAACPRFLATDRDGDACRAFADARSELANEAKRRYCRDHASDSACRCLSRDLLPAYQGLKPSRVPDANDACWWKACSDADPASLLLTGQDASPALRGQCPATSAEASSICAQVVAQARATGNYDNLRAHASCAALPSPPRATDSPRGWQVLLWVLAGVVGALALVALAYFAYAALSRAARGTAKKAAQDPTLDVAYVPAPASGPVYEGL